MLQTPSPNITLEEFLKLPETKPASEYTDRLIRCFIQSFHQTKMQSMLSVGCYRKYLASISYL